MLHSGQCGHRCRIVGRCHRQEPPFHRPTLVTCWIAFRFGDGSKKGETVPTVPFRELSSPTSRKGHMTNGRDTYFIRSRLVQKSSHHSLRLCLLHRSIVCWVGVGLGDRGMMISHRYNISVGRLSHYQTVLDKLVMNSIPQNRTP